MQGLVALIRLICLFYHFSLAISLVANVFTPSENFIAVMHQSANNILRHVEAQAFSLPWHKTDGTGFGALQICDFTRNAVRAASDKDPVVFLRKARIEDNKRNKYLLFQSSDKNVIHPRTACEILTPCDIWEALNSLDSTANGEKLAFKFEHEIMLTGSSNSMDWRREIRSFGVDLDDDFDDLQEAGYILNAAEKPTMAYWVTTKHKCSYGVCDFSAWFVSNPDTPVFDDLKAVDTGTKKTYGIMKVLGKKWPVCTQDLSEKRIIRYAMLLTSKKVPASGSYPGGVLHLNRAPTSSTLIDPIAPPSTAAPPITEAPTEAPITETSTAAPITEAPITEAPITEAPTAAPSTETSTATPSTEAPTAPPTTQVPTKPSITSSQITSTTTLPKNGGRTSKVLSLSVAGGSLAAIALTAAWKRRAFHEEMDASDFDLFEVEEIEAPQRETIITLS